MNGAPPFAPLLFPNLVLLGLIALWALGRRMGADAAAAQAPALSDAARAEQNPHAV